MTLPRRRFLWLGSAALAGCATGASGAARPASAPAQERAAPFEIVDAMPSFWAFWEGAQGQSADVAFEAFEREVIARYPELYTPAVLGLGDEEHALRARFDAWWAELPPRIPRLREISEALPGQLTVAAARFIEALPAFQWDGRCYLFASLDAFNGAGRMIGGAPQLAFGLDVIARGGPSMPGPVLFTHELFHFHQRQPEQNLIAAGVWFEGLAVHASRVLNPGATLDQVLPEQHLHDPSNPQLMNPARALSAEHDLPRWEAELARMILGALESSSEEDYATFFLGRASDALGERPVRSAYYFGLRTAERLAAQGHDLQALSERRPESMVPAIRATLEALAAG
jgi:hypothetical protein